MIKYVFVLALAAGCSGGTAGDDSGDDVAGDDGGGDDGPNPDPNGTSPRISGCSILPSDHVFNTPIDSLPAVHDLSDTWVSLIGNGTRLHLDLGTQMDSSEDDFYGIPYNVVDASAMTWEQVEFSSPDPSLDWDPTDEADCGSSSKSVVSPCTTATAYLPFAANMLVEGGLSTAVNHMPAEDHHLLVLDTASCRLWEGYHVYRPNGQWEIFGAATFDLDSNDLRTAGWTSADAAGFPILPLLLRADEAATGEIKHALRFTIPTGSIRGEYTWPGRHKTGEDMSTSEPPMGQLFRLKASFVIPDDYSTQSKAILQAMKTYGMYLADGGSAWYVTGAPGDWDDSVFDEVQSVEGSNFEAVDMRPIIERAGFDPDSGRVPAL